MEEKKSRRPEIVHVIGEQMREHARCINEVIERLEAQGGPVTPEEWAFYAQHKQISLQELAKLEADGTNFLADCFRKAIAARDKEFRKAIDVGVKKYGRPGVAKTEKEAGANQLGMHLLGFLEDDVVK